MSNNSGTLLLLLLALVGGLWAISSSEPKETADQAASVPETLEETLARRQEERRFFLVLQKPILQDLSVGNITLRAASEKLMHLSLQYYADFLRNVGFTEGGATPLENTARNCLRQCRVAGNEYCQLTDAIEADLKRQLTALILEEKEKSP